MKQKIYIAIPTTDGNVNASLAQLTCAAERMNGADDCPAEFTVRYFVGYRPVAFMRNSIFGAFLASDADALLMYDQDVVPPAGALRMLGIEGDIVAGMIPGGKAPAEGPGFVVQILAFSGNPLQPIEYPEPGTVNRYVDAAGAGAMLIRRHVLEDPRMRLIDDPPENERGRGWCPAIYDVPLTPWGELKTTGDIDFCLRARGCGYRVSLWTQELFGQRESLDLRDVVAYGARCAAKVEVTA